MEERVFIGIDPTAGKRPITYAILDERGRLIKIADGGVSDLLDEIGSRTKVICAVDAPSGTNAGLMADPEYRAELGLPPHSSRYAGYRVGEYELRRRGIGLYPTPRLSVKAAGWMRFGWGLYRSLRDAGYILFPGTGEKIVAEVHANACFTVLLGRRPYSKHSLEGRVQRQLLLYDRCIGVPDPMMVFEEITRHRLLSGDLHLDGILWSHDELDAVVAAYTAWRIGCEPEAVCAVGDPEEGVIVVPVSALQDAYGSPLGRRARSAIPSI